MSGSPPLPLPNTSQEAGDHHRGQSAATYGSSYPAAAGLHDAYRGGSAAHSQQATTIPGPPPPQTPLGPPPHQQQQHAPRPSYQQQQQQPEQQPERLAYSYPRPEDPASAGSASSYPHLPGPPLQQQRRPSYMSMAGPSSGVAAQPLPPPGPMPQQQQQQGPYAAQHAVQPTTEDGQPFTSPKSQRKTKGHVASACVPCKKAHLRCDARRPCSRCQSNGKEDACIDVQHKKRGRPRLRDERDNRYGPPAGYPHPQDAAMRRPLSLYSPGGPMSGYDDPIRRSQSHRVLKSHQSEPLGPRYIERAAPSDASMYAPPPLAIATSPSGPEPVAYLSPGLEIVRASPTFIDAVGVPSVRGRSLFDIVAQSEGHKVQRLQVSMQEERGRKDPMYLPPIFGKDHEVRVFETLRYDAEELSRIPMDRHEVLVFVAADGQKRPFQVRLGSAKRDSIYFVALSLHIPAGFPYSTPSPHARDVPYNWPPQASMHSQQQPGPQQQQYAHPPPIHGGYDSGQRYGDASMQPRPGTAGPPPQIVTGLSSGVGAAAYSPGIVSGMSAYAASPSRPDYAIGSTSSQIPRSELQPAGRAPQPPQQHQQHYQLPPIRSSPQQDGGVRHEPPPRRDERSGRVDIGGLIDKPDQPPPSR